MGISHLYWILTSPSFAVHFEDFRFAVPIIFVTSNVCKSANAYFSLLFKVVNNKNRLKTTLGLLCRLQMTIYWTLPSASTK